MIKSGTFGPLLNDRYEGYVDDIHASARHLLGLIEDILEMSKAEAGRLEVAEEPVDLAHVAGRAAHMLAERARRGGIDLSGPSPDAPRTAAARRRAAADAGGAEPDRQCRQVHAGGRAGDVRRRPGSTGWCRPPRSPRSTPPVPAIPRTLLWWSRIPASASRIASSPAYSSRSSRSGGPGNAQREGAGLGLALSRTLVELHGGVLVLASAPGRGTTAVARFPRDRVIGE